MKTVSDDELVALYERPRPDVLSAGWDAHLLTGQTDWARMARERRERTPRRRTAIWRACAAIGQRIATWTPLGIIGFFMATWLVAALVLVVMRAT